MKAKHVFLTVGLSLAMAGSLATAGLLGMANDVEPTKAATQTTIYCAIDSATLGTYSLKLNVNRKGDGDDWASYNMSALGEQYDSKDVYRATFTDLYDGLGCIQFQLYDGDEWKAQDQVFGTKDWHGESIYNNKLHVYGGSGWVNFAPSNSFNVDVYVDGTLRGNETIAEGLLPASPTAYYGEAFSGWFTNPECTGTEVTGVTSNAALYGKVITLPTITYSIDVSKVASAFGDDLYLYAWEGSKLNAAWPGEQITNGSITVPNDAQIIICDVSAGSSLRQTANITQSGVANDTLIILNEVEDGKYKYMWASDIDVPAEEGYYICGEFSSNPCWKYANAEQMTPTTGENVAYEMNFLLAVGDQLRVRSYFTDRPNGQAADQWATLGDNGYADETNGWGKKTGDNFEATKAGYYDIYAKYIGDDFMFFVAEHVDTYQIDLSAIKFEGKDLASVQALDYQLAYDGSNFEPQAPAIAGYAYRGAYVDSDCSNKYTPTTFNAAGHLYLKYTRLGFYVAGDATYTGSADTAWLVDGATYLPAATNDPNNMLEGSVTIPDSASAQNPVKVKALQYVGGDQNNGWAAISYTMPLEDEYSFVSLDADSNLEFTKGGTYAVYVNHQAEVYLSEGAQAFYTKFLNEVGGVCSEILAGTKTLDQLKAIWLEQKAAYQSLSAEEKVTIAAKTIDGGDENGSDLEKVIAKYSYIVHKYGTNNCEDFIWGQTYAAQSNGFNALAMNNNIVLITVIALGVSVISAAGLFFILRRKRLVK